jgi:hypothetical protein
MDFYNEPPKDYVSLNLGSQSAPEAAPPTGSAGAGALPSSLNVGPRASIPESYGLGETSAVGMQKQDSVMGALAAFFEGASTPAGEIPASQKLRLAQRKASLDEAEYQLKVKNYNDTHAALQQTAKIQNERSITHGFETWQNILGASAMMDDEGRQAAKPMWQQLMKGSHPELEGLVDTLVSKPHLPLGYSSLAQDPELGKIYQPLMSGRPLKDIYNDKELEQGVNIFGYDSINKITSRIPQAFLQEVKAGKHSQAEFLEKFVTAADDTTLRGMPVDKAFAKQFLLNTPQGEAFMVGWNVNTDQRALAQSKKEKPSGSDTITGIKAQEYKKYEAQLAFEKDNPGSFTPEQLSHATKQMGLLLGTESKDQGVNPNNTVNQRLQILSKGKLQDVDSIATMKPGPEKDKAYALAAQARAQQDQASGMGQLVAKMATPGDTSQYIYADRLLKTGHAIPVRENLTEGDLRTNKNFVKTTPEQRKSITELNIAVQSANDIFDSAEVAYKGDQNRMGTASAEIALKSDDSAVNLPAKLIAKSAYPKLAEYVARREATLGKFARGISGEVGVLTDQDVVRVRNLFPTAGDTPQIRTSKRKSLNALLALNRKFQAEVLAGELSPDEVQALKQSPAYMSAAQGILGGAEGLGATRAGKETQPQAGESLSRGESLLKRM